jgi:BirA family biotin operon repressor/biotin-[acetyl-CoA-carboxylase] ligase
MSEDTPIHVALDAAALRDALSAAVGARYTAIEVLDEIDSTNSALLRRRTPEHGIVALFAERQSGGRGRQGRVWASPAGANLYLSLARGFDGPLARLGGLSLAAGVAVAEALHAFGATTVAVKWPNDLVVDDDATLRKLGGILVEAGLQDGRARAVVGLGLNLRMPVDAAAGIDQPWTDLEALLRSETPARAAVAVAVLTALAEALDTFDAQGLAPFLPRFAALDALRGAEVVALTGGQETPAIAEGIDTDGALRLRTAAGEIALRAGEVSLRKPGLPRPGLHSHASGRA